MGFRSKIVCLRSEPVDTILNNVKNLVVSIPKKTMDLDVVQPPF